MNKLITGTVWAAGSLAMVVWSPANGGQYDRDSGNAYANRTRQGNDENIKRAQGDDSGRRNVHDPGYLLGRW